MTFKESVCRHCSDIVAGRISGLRQTLAGIAESIANETKSTAGDKYETARAMLHIEQEQLGRQLTELLVQQAALDAIDVATASRQISQGSLVIAKDACFFISTALGRITVAGRPVIALSLASPLGKRLKGLTAGDTFDMNGKPQVILSVE